VILDLTDPRSQWQRLGHAYRVDVHVVIWESEAVDIVPLTALFRHEDGWALFIAEQGVARMRKVSIGHRSGLDVEVTDGITSGELVVVNPSERIEDGTPIQSRHRT
jgi:HlyD family secretion protein